jgi:hypothetical protein
MGRMDARRDTPVIPCGPKVDITCAADYETERGNGLVEDMVAGILDPSKTFRTAVDAAFSYASRNS